MKLLTALSLLLLLPLCMAATVYKYQDENGKWHFTDKQREAPKDAQSQTFKKRKGLAKPKIIKRRHKDGRDQLVAINPYFTPMQALVEFNETGEKGREVIEANSEKVLIEQLTSEQEAFQYQFIWGDPDNTVDASQPANYAPPLARNIEVEVTQAFHGRYSHFNKPNLYAVDLAMEVGSEIHAVADGIVAMVKDDFHLGGANQFFADKANLVAVLHEDGAIAIYAHILLGSAKVKAGQKISQGDVLALIGSSGYSTGPHLHFVVWYNDNSQLRSRPLRFVTSPGKVVKPQAGVLLSH